MQVGARVCEGEEAARGSPLGCSRRERHEGERRYEDRSELHGATVDPAANRRLTLVGRVSKSHLTGEHLFV